MNKKIERRMLELKDGLIYALGGVPKRKYNYTNSLLRARTKDYLDMIEKARQNEQKYNELREKVMALQARIEKW